MSYYDHAVMITYKLGPWAVPAETTTARSVSRHPANRCRPWSGGPQGRFEPCVTRASSLSWLKGKLGRKPLNVKHITKA